MDTSSFNNKIIILRDNTKSSFIRYIGNKLLNIKIITLSELKKLLFFDYDKETIYYVCKKYKVVSDIAKKMIENIYYITDIDNDKVNFLYELKRDLESNNLLYKNELFKDYIKNKKLVLIDNEYYDKFYLDILSNYDTEEYKIYNNKSVKKLYKCSNKSEEIELLANNICSLIKSGVDINKIKIANVSDNYYFDILKTFKLFNIPINLKNNNSINGAKIVNIFKENYSSDINSTLGILLNYIKSDEESEIYKQIINIVNSYSFTSDYNEVKDFIFEDINKIKVNNKVLSNAVEVIDFETDIILDDEYVFLINYNEDVIPVNHKNEDYFSDEVKTKLGISESFDLNKKSILNIQNKIESIKHLIVSYSSYELNNELYISSSYLDCLFEKCEYKSEYIHSNKYNKLKLVAFKDDFYKYGIVSDDLILLNNKYKTEKYLSYSNKYKLIDSKSLYDYLSNSLSLSYTSLNSYNECAFKYYLNYVLKLNKFESTFDTCIGNIFHKILSLCFDDGFDFEESWNNEIINLKYELSNMEKFFLNKLKSDLKFTIETIKSQLNYTSLSKIMYEKEIIININDDLHISFKGIVDKIMYEEIGGFNIVCIVDYKTGNPNINIENCKCGLDMQLPIYIYLVKNSNILSNIKIGGFYLQKIVNNKTSIDEKMDSLKLQGYSNSDENILKYVDSSYEDSKIIKSLRVSKNGFYSYSKVLSESEIDNLESVVENNIINSSQDILNAKFDINPKMLDGKNKSCNFCEYKDICYMRNDDIVNLDGIMEEEDE